MVGQDVRITQVGPLGRARDLPDDHTNWRRRRRAGRRQPEEHRDEERDARADLPSASGLPWHLKILLCDCDGSMS
jgi:hypothetical protein